MPPRSTVFERAKKAGLEHSFHTLGSVWTDDCVKAVLDFHAAQFKSTSTAVFFTSDHNRFQGKGTCYQRGIKMPFGFQWQGKVSPNTYCRQRLSMQDMFPTVLDIAGIPIPPSLTLDGISALPYLTQKKSPDTQRALYFEFGYARAILQGNFKYIALRFPNKLIHNMMQDTSKRLPDLRGKATFAANIQWYDQLLVPDQLYDVQQDPEEMHNQPQDPRFADKLSELRSLLLQHLQSIGRPIPCKMHIPTCSPLSTCQGIDLLNVPTIWSPCIGKKKGAIDALALGLSA